MSRVCMCVYLHVYMYVYICAFVCHTNECVMSKTRKSHVTCVNSFVKRHKVNVFLWCIYVKYMLCSHHMYSMQHIWVCIYICIYIHIYIYMYVYIYIYMCIYVCESM